MYNVKLLHDFFVFQSQKNPNQIAVVDFKKSYTYKEIETSANRLAFELTSHSPALQQDKIGFFTDRSVDSIIIMLGILKSGHAFVPIDPNLPAKRIEYICDKATIKTIVSGNTEYYSSKKQTIIHLRSIITVKDFKYKEIKIPDDRIAYCLFTSGSTGRPKGALIKHSGIVQSIKNFKKAYHFDKNSKVLQFASLSYDASLSEIFPTFAAGGTIYIPPREVILDIDKLSSYIIESGITAAIFPPTVIGHLNKDSLSSLSTLVSAGEECPADLANRMYELVPHFINAYGPTEASVGVTTFELDRKIKNAVPIGKALPGYKIYILNKVGQRVSIGQIGELCIGGVGVFAGYIGDSAKTHEVLIPNPFGVGYLYKTGDLVKQDANGQIYYVGRNDFQIKLHSIRMSPEEIEREIKKLPKINECVVVDGCLESNKEHKLVCYFTASEDLNLTVTRDILRSKLQPHMIPQVFIHIPSMPLTPSGKIDRHALQIKPVRIKTETDTLNDSVISDSPIARIWKDILGTNSVSLEDNFFELGGSSISAMRIVSKINKNTDFHANINLIFEYPVFNDFVRALEKEASETEKEHDKTFADQKLTDPEKLFWAANYTSKKPEAYTLTEVFELNGQINTNRLQRSFEFLISQFPKLRTNFRFRFDKIEKVIKNEKSYPFCLRDYSNLDISRARKKARQTQEHIANIPMDLEKDWLFVAYYLKLSEVEGLLIFHAHHIVMDARAMEIISKKFWDYYEHHQDYKLVENINSMHSQPTDDEKTFWKEYLSRADDNLTSLPYDNPKNETTENNGKTIIHPLPLRLAREGSKTATALGITPFSLFRNIFSLLLHRLSNQVNLTVGTAVSLRDDNSENDIGVFLNTLPIRSTLRSGEPIEKYLVRQNKEFIHCFKHRNLSLPHILKLIQNDCKKDSQPLFNVMFDYIAEEGTSKVIGLQVKRQRAFPATALFDLTLTVKELNCGFELLWEYNTNLFNEKTLRKFMNWYENIFHNSINDLKQNASKIDFLTQKEKQLLEDFNSTDITIPNSCFIQEFEKNISKFSDKIAATSGDKTIDYKTLNQKANILARKLLEHKIGINDKIGVLMPRGIDLIISILAIWKVRAVYVPLEPDFPDDRIRQMSMQANLSCIISKNEYSRERVITEVPFLHFDSVQKKKEADMENLNIRGSMNDLVYVIFTSGSTGKPKGVMIEQLGMVNHCNEMIKFFHLKENTIMAQTASHCFDISIWQLVAPLLIGGKIIIYSKDHQLNLKALFESIIEDKITIAELVPSYLFALLEHINHHVNNNRLNDLCHMLTTGEAASNKLVESWYAIYPEIPLTNAYGPAEASDDTNLYTLTKQEAIPNTPIPVGKPIGNVKIYILDSFLNRCPIGIKGEIYISGIAVGKGYINDHEKTKAAFLTNPFSGNKERMYKTGDIGSWNSDGTINFYGRTDFQVKIRGYRIELEEIENQIEDIPYVSQAVIIVKNFGNSKQLYAFITGQGQIEENPIRSSLQAKLPAYMIPQRIIQLNEIPLNHNGKADRKLLSKIDIANHQEKLDKVLSEKQQILLETWKSIFKDNEITINDNFFDLGGDSISSIQIISRLLSQGYELDIENFFAHPTICQLASFVIKKQYIGSIPISEKPFFLTPIQKSFLEKSLGNPNWYNQCVVIEGKKWNTEKLKESLLHTLKAHPAFSLRFNNFEQQYIKSVDFSKYIFEYSADELNDEQILSNMNKMINIKEGPIIVATISDKGNSEFKLFIVAHHLIIDAFSWSIFIDDLEKNYHNALLENNHNQKSLGSNLHEWATYLEKRSFKKIVSSRLPYWEKILKDNKIPISSSIPQKNNGNHRIISLGANANFSKKIADFIANNSSLKLEHLVISILTRALCKWLASDEIAVMLERHGRSHVPNNFNISRTIGWFTVIHPFLVKLNMDGNIAQAHAIAKDLENLKDDGISYGLLKYRGSMNNPLKKIPEPDIAINFLGEMCRANSNGYFSNYKLIPDQTVDPRRQLEYKLEINTYLVEGRLVIECTYDQECFPISLMNQLVEEIEINIKNLSAEIDSSKRDKKIEMPTSSFSNERLSEIQNRLAGTISNG